MSNLILPSDVRAAFQLSSNLPDDDVNRFITSAQVGDFRYYLGDDLYYSLANNYDQEEGIYKDLWTGTSYLNESGKTRYFDGVKSLLVWLSVKVLVNQERWRSTRSGMAKQRKNNSEVLDGQDLDSLNYYVRGQFITAHHNLREYMDAKGDLYDTYEEIKPVTVL